MFNFAKWHIALIVVILNGYVPLVSGDSTVNHQLVSSLEDMLPSLVAAEDYRAASNISFQIASAQERLGETPAACAALAQSLELYRKAVQNESGEVEAAVSRIDDGSDGMAEVRVKFGCARA
jgi:hypothetical protein